MKVKGTLPPSDISTVVRYAFEAITFSPTPPCTTAMRKGTSTVAGAPAGPAMTRPWMPIRAVISPPLRVHSRAILVIVAWKRIVIADGRLAGGADRVGRGPGAHRDLRTIDVVIGRRLAGRGRRLGLGRLVGLAAEQALEAVGQRLGRHRRDGGAAQPTTPARSPYPAATHSAMTEASSPSTPILHDHPPADRRPASGLYRQNRRTQGSRQQGSSRRRWQPRAAAQPRKSSCSRPNSRWSCQTPLMQR